MNLHKQKPGRFPTTLTFSVLLCAAVLCACTPAAERRPFGTVINDQTAEIRIVGNLKMIIVSPGRSEP